MKKVLTTRNVYTGKVMSLCRPHYDANENGTDQVSHGLHTGLCDVCEGREQIQASSYVSPIAEGARVETGEGDDHDTGRVESIDGIMAFVAWDSGVKTSAPLSDLRAL